MTYYSRETRQRIRNQISHDGTVNPNEDFGWLIGAVNALLEHAEYMDEALEHASAARDEALCTVEKLEAALSVKEDYLP